MSYEQTAVANEIHSHLSQEFKDLMFAREFTTRGSDLAFRFNYANDNQANMVKIMLNEFGIYNIQFYERNDARKIFNKVGTITNVCGPHLEKEIKNFLNN